jgi:hypothetical protein
MLTQSETIEIRLNQTEALVLFEWLAKRDESASQTSTDQAEQQVLWKLEGQLESALADVLSADYSQRVTEAKQTILGMFG